MAGDELTLGEPEPAPGGRLWPVTGCGTITLNGQRVPVVTCADSEAQAHRLHLLGRHLPGWRCEDGQIPFLGQPEAWGAEGDAPLRRLTTGMVLQAIQRRLGGQLVEWRRDEVVVARSMFVALGRGSGSRWLRWRPGLYGSAQRDFRPAGIYGCGRRRRRPRRRLALGVTPSSRFRSPARRRRPHGFRGHFDRCAPDGPLQVAIVVRRRAS